MVPASNSPPSGPRPAHGERRAVRNLSAQYRIAAALTYDALQLGELEWVRLIDPDAGRLDDVVIARPGRLDAYQIKWSEYRNLVRFRDLITASTISGKPYPAPFELMADGWKRLRAVYPMRCVHAHFLMHDAPSARDITNGLGQGCPSHLQSFLRKAFPHRSQWFEPNNALYQEWSVKINSIAAVSGLVDDELHAFIANCDLDLGVDLPDRSSPQQTRRADDIEALAHFFMQRVSDGTGPIELRPHDIIRGVGWADRFELRFKHDFPIDERLYQPIERTVSELNEAIERFRSGYIALCGPPGSGKSTTLTYSLRYREGIQLIRYYAFVRDDPRLGRGEAVAFLHDLCLSLEGIGNGRSNRFAAIPDTIHGLRDRIGVLLSELGQDSARNGALTVILIDGLDHIEREQSPERSLIEELPPPSAIPDGVLIVLGTQPVGLCGPSHTLRPIRTQLQEPGRILTMDRLLPTGVHAILRTVVPDGFLRAGDEKIVYQLSAGHPLSLAYLVKRLAAAPDASAVIALLEDSPSLDGDTDAEYTAYWEQLSSDAEVRELLAFLARIRGAVELATIKNLAARGVVERFVKSAFYLFRQLTPERWAFFHNSFRQFVLRMTQRDAFGSHDSERVASYHRRLAAVAEDITSPVALRWECLYHLEQAGETQDIVERTQQCRFREQFLSGRSLMDVREDIYRGLRAAANLQDAIAITRLLLIDKELVERDQALGETDVTESLVELADPADRATALMVGDELLVSEDVAFRWAARLLENGNAAFAVRLFDVAEPIDILAGVKRVPEGGNENLNAWSLVSWRFRPLKQVIDAIGHVRVEQVRSLIDDNCQSDDPEANETAMFNLLVNVGVGIQDAADEAKYSELIELLNAIELGRKVLLALNFRSARLFVAGLPTIGDPIDAMVQVTSVITPDKAGQTDAALFADVLTHFTLLAQQADAYLDACPVPIVKTEFGHTGNRAFDPVEALFRQARACAARGRPLDPLAITETEENWDFGRILFQRLVVIVATLWGEAVAGHTLSPAEFVRRLGPVLAFRRRSFRDASDWHDWSAISAATGDLYERALLAAEAHGPEVLHNTLNALIEEWRHPRQQDQVSWPTAIRRRIVLAAYRIDRDKGRTEALLTEIDGELSPSWDLHERIEELDAAAKAWLQLGHRDKARAALDAMFLQSFGIYHHKDRQIQDWVRWVTRLIEVGAEQSTIERAVFTLLKLIPLLYEARRGRGTSDATGELIEVLARHWPTVAYTIGEWLLDQGAAERATVIGALLCAELRSGDARRVAEALVAAARLLLPFSGYDEHISDAFEELLASPLADHPMVQDALSVVHRIADGRAQSGHLYLNVLKGMIKVKTPDENKEEESSSPRLVRTNGTELGQAEVERLAARPAELATALTGAYQKGSLDWTPVIQTLFASEEGQLVRRAKQALLEQTLSSPELELFVERAAALGERSLAELATDRVIAEGRPYGWLRFYDGGSRLSAARCLRLLDPQSGRARALKLFVDDYITHGLSPGELISGLDKLLPEFTDTLPLPALWCELEEHLSALVDVKTSPFQPPVLTFSNEPENPTPSIQLLLKEIDDLSVALSWEARRGLVDILKLGDLTGTARRGLREALAGDHQLQTAALATLGCLASEISDLAVDFAPDLETLAWAPSAVTRLAAQTALKDLGRTVPPNSATKALPAIYQLYFPNASRPEANLRGDITPFGEPLPDTTDPFDLTRLYHNALHMLEKRTNYSFDLLVRRMAQLMIVVAPPERWSATTEQQHMQVYKDIGIKLNYRRPRSLVAQHAFGLLVAELCDGEAIDWLPRAYEHFLVIADPIVNILDPTRRPTWIEVPSGEALGKYPEENWLESVAEALPSLDRTPDGCVVLAELTTVVSLDRDREEENRLSVIGHPDLPFHTDRFPDIYELWHQERYAARDYPHLFRLDEEILISIVAGGAIFADSRFIAFNPVIGTQLGWHTSVDGLFRWIDHRGDIMVESLHWAEGNIDLHDCGDMNAKACEGWLVLATEPAWQQIRPLLRRFVRHRMAGRQTGFARNEERGLRVASDLSKIAY